MPAAMPPELTKVTLSESRTAEAIQDDLQSYLMSRRVVEIVADGDVDVTFPQYQDALSSCRLHRLRAVCTAIGMSAYETARFLILHESEATTADLYRRQLNARLSDSL